MRALGSRLQAVQLQNFTDKLTAVGGRLTNVTLRPAVVRVTCTEGLSSVNSVGCTLKAAIVQIHDVNAIVSSSHVATVVLKQAISHNFANVLHSASTISSITLTA